MNDLVRRDENTREGYLQVPNYVEPSTPMLPDIARMQPLAPLSDRTIKILARVRRRELQVQEVEARINALTLISRDHAALASQWLAGRFPGEQNIRIDTAAMSDNRNILFGRRGERLRISTQVSIW